MQVTIIGTGYVGLTTAIALAYVGHDVTAVDKDQRKLTLLQNGQCPIHEPGVDTLLAQIGARIHFTDTLHDSVPHADVIFIAVGTPPKENGEADLQYVESAACEIASALLPGQACTIVVKSTVPIGTNRRVIHLVERTLHERNVQAHVSFASNPEFLREGVALRDTFYADRIVAGSDQPEAIEALSRLYRPILEQTFLPPSFLPRTDGAPLPYLITTDLTSAEMTKYASNAFLPLKISFINEIAGLCEKVGADVTEVARGIGMDPRIGHRFLNAGIGWGGSCFPKDTAALISVAAEYGYTMPLLAAAREVNDRQRLAVVDKLQSKLKGLRGRVIGVLGLAFKPNTDDVRDSPAIDIIRILIERGAHVRAHDPVAVPNARRELDGLDIQFVEQPSEVAIGADGILLATEWDEYHTLNLAGMAKTMKNPLLVDGRNLYKPSDARAAGMEYLG
ncbi:MAG TPA: UDP-glucose/GDP-mannose dehydrogenase family protein, partial [Armatimonadota bacterium]